MGSGVFDAVWPLTLDYILEKQECIHRNIYFRGTIILEIRFDDVHRSDASAPLFQEWKGSHRRTKRSKSFELPSCGEPKFSSSSRCLESSVLMCKSSRSHFRSDPVRVQSTSLNDGDPEHTCDPSNDVGKAHRGRCGFPIGRCFENRYTSAISRYSKIKHCDRLSRSHAVSPQRMIIIGVIADIFKSCSLRLIQRRLYQDWCGCTPEASPTDVGIGKPLPHSVAIQYRFDIVDPKVTKNCLYSRVGLQRTGIGVVFN